ncbi:PREDICTED: uncharacterized protein LOC106888100 [Calidris pugnax]|uniref:uncharacterized protein LOC106888100 n=1 Tax=Calidris pugnax TaxID=198806 RepID=UPI00071CCAB4|nr:PREDICTED: uncharacterized protein LOC106888100 [Calidris pugnax]
MPSNVRSGETLLSSEIIAGCPRAAGAGQELWGSPCPSGSREGVWSPRCCGRGWRAEAAACRGCCSFQCVQLQTCPENQRDPGLLVRVGSTTGFVLKSHGRGGDGATTREYTPTSPVRWGQTGYVTCSRSHEPSVSEEKLQLALSVVRLFLLTANTTSSLTSPVSFLSLQMCPASDSEPAIPAVCPRQAWHRHMRTKTLRAVARENNREIFKS